MFRIGDALCFWAVAFSLAAATAPNDAVIAKFYARGLAGDKQAVIDCVAALEQRLNSQPNDQLARVYLGSACTLLSRDLPFGPAKLSALRRGISLMDEAAAAAPNDARVQLLRAITYESFPAILAHGRIAREALDDLVLAIERHPEKLKASDRELLYLNAGEAAAKAGDKMRALDLWRRGLALDADPKLSAEIRAALSSP
jgi:tetratricopeptide (TPR) repeat protein